MDLSGYIAGAVIVAVALALIWRSRKTKRDPLRDPMKPGSPGEGDEGPK